MDKIGDCSSSEERQEYFREIDKDQSDGVDFEEFLQVSHHIIKTQSYKGIIIAYGEGAPRRRGRGRVFEQAVSLHKARDPGSFPHHTAAAS